MWNTTMIRLWDDDTLDYRACRWGKWSVAFSSNLLLTLRHTAERSYEVAEDSRLWPPFGDLEFLAPLKNSTLPHVIWELPTPVPASDLLSNQKLRSSEPPTACFRACIHKHARYPNKTSGRMARMASSTADASVRQTGRRREVNGNESNSLMSNDETKSRSPLAESVVAEMGHGNGNGYGNGNGHFFRHP